jgi:hypothetical protein
MALDSDPNWNYDNFALIHGQSLSQHGTPWFLAWHRVFVFKFEERLRYHKGCDMTVPYWDWSLDAPAELSSPVFGASQLGPKLGVPASYCLGTSFLSAAPEFGANSNSHSTPFGMPTCVARRPSVSQFTDLATLVGLLATPNFGPFSSSVEGAPHGNVHMYVGGTSFGHMGNIMWSPDDPLFWLHHAFLDNVWAAWQACHGYDLPPTITTPNMYSASSGTYGMSQPMHFGTAPWSSEIWRYQDVHSIQNLQYSYSFDPFSTSPLLAPICSSALGAKNAFRVLTPSYSAQTRCRICVDESPLFGWCDNHYGGGYCWNPQQGPYSCPANNWYRPLNNLRRDCEGNYVRPSIAINFIKRTDVLQREIDLYNEVRPAPTIPNAPYTPVSEYGCRLLKRESQDYYRTYNDAANQYTPGTSPDPNDPRQYSPRYDFGNSPTPLTNEVEYGRRLLHGWFDQMDRMMSPNVNPPPYGSIIDSGAYDPPCSYPYYFSYTNDPHCRPQTEVEATGVTMIGELAVLSYGRIRPDCPEAYLRPATLAAPLANYALTQDRGTENLAPQPVPSYPVEVSYDDEIPNTSYLRWFDETHRETGYPQLSVDVGIHSILIRALDNTYFDENDYIYVEGAVNPTICPGQEPRAYIADARVVSSVDGISRRAIRVTDGGLRIFLGVPGRPVTHYCQDDYLTVHLEYKY